MWCLMAQVYMLYAYMVFLQRCRGMLKLLSVLISSATIILHLIRLMVLCELDALPAFPLDASIQQQHQHMKLVILHHIHTRAIFIAAIPCIYRVLWSKAVAFFYSTEKSYFLCFTSKFIRKSMETLFSFSLIWFWFVRKR